MTERRMNSNTKILITGGSGFLGVRLASLLLARNPATRITLTDIAEHPRAAALRGHVDFHIGDMSDAETCRRLITDEVGTVYHFASLVSGGAERDFEAGLKANVLATLYLLEACRLRGRRPRFVFTSSIATFGGAKLPSTIDDWTHQHPQNSYGVAKVVGEQWLTDYSRKGFVDGRGVRLPAIVVRDEPNSAASGYASALFREPLHGRDYACPVGESARIPIMSVSRAIETLAQLGALEGAAMGDFRTINGPSLSPSAGEIATAVRGFAKRWPTPLGKITFAPDPAIERMISAWPQHMKATRAQTLGLQADESLLHIIEDYIKELSAEGAGKRTQA
jgi:nucleoside-diphosphate-sugar epimerase